MGLSEAQVVLIREQWALLAKDKKQNGTDLFVIFFTDFPDYLSMFPMLQGLTPEELKVSPKLKAHGLTFMHAVNSFVENLDDADTLVQLLRKNVERHSERKLNINKGAFHTVWGLFPKFLDIKLGEKYDDASKEAWDAAVGFMSQVTDDTLDAMEKEEKEAAGAN